MFFSQSQGTITLSFYRAAVQKKWAKFIVKLKPIWGGGFQFPIPTIWNNTVTVLTLVPKYSYFVCTFVHLWWITFFWDLIWFIKLLLHWKMVHTKKNTRPTTWPYKRPLCNICLIPLGRFPGDSKLLNICPCVQKLIQMQCNLYGT